MSTSPLAGHPAPRSLLVNVPRLVSSYFNLTPDPDVPAERVAFGTSGHRGSALTRSFQEAHILAVTQAIVAYRARAGIDGPLFLGRDTHALSEPAFATALEVLAANGVDTRVDAADGYTPTPALSHAIVCYNRGRVDHLADGIVITPSHNPPDDGGFKYNPPNGGPADTDITSSVERAANELIRAGNRDVRRVPLARALGSSCVRPYDFIAPYVEDLANVIDVDVIRASGLKIGCDPMGGAGLPFWGPIAERYKLDIEVVNDVVDPSFAFMTVDGDGKIRMDCSSPFAMASLVRLKDRFGIAFGNDVDADRHGLVTPVAGLMSPNAYLAVAIDYLFRQRPAWRADAAVGKTMVSSSLINRVAARLKRRVAEVPVGFKYFVEGLRDGSYGFGGEESAGASFLRKDGGVWTTDKDGILLNLLGAEITARTGRDLGDLYRKLTSELGEPVYARTDAPASAAQKAALKKLAPGDVTASTLAGEPILEKLTASPEGAAPLGGLKVVTANGWFAARPSGTEDKYKIYAESFRGAEHLEKIQMEARDIVAGALAS